MATSDAKEALVIFSVNKLPELANSNGHPHFTITETNVIVFVILPNLSHLYSA